MSGTLIKVKGEKGEGGNGIVRVSTYSKELGKTFISAARPRPAGQDR